MVSYYPIQLNYTCDVASMKSWFDNSYLSYREKDLPEKILYAFNIYVFTVTTFWT